MNAIESILEVETKRGLQRLQREFSAKLSELLSNANEVRGILSQIQAEIANRNDSPGEDAKGSDESDEGDEPDEDDKKADTLEAWPGWPETTTPATSSEPAREARAKRSY